ncbi:unnamed protein product [Somion occarium]|uniref:RING-type E3 ubiquitin transferase n=1 Tax=Somion occarium TaxID=3059160 RepID=A0ABP1D6U6_9APHY
MTARISSPPTKRIKLESSLSPSLEPQDELNPDVTAALEEEDVEQCSICLQPLAGRTLIPTCSHEFCFECLLVWTDQSRRCPLCSQGIGDYLIHHIRSKYDFQKRYLTALRTSPKPQPLPPVAGASRGRRSGRRRDRDWGTNTRRERDRELEAIDALDRAIEKRRWVYRHRLYAKHVASNPYTRYRAFPTPAQFAANPDLVTRATIFVRRELRVWGCLDVEFLTTFTISLMKSLDIRSEPAIKLLSEFLDLDSEHELQVRGRNDGPWANAEHFAHELYCYLRSPYRDLSVYDTIVQYDVPEGIPPPYHPSRSSRWQSRSPSSSRRRRPRSRSRSRSRSVSRPGSNQARGADTLLNRDNRREVQVRSRSGSRSRRDRRPCPVELLDEEYQPKGDKNKTENAVRRDIKGKGRAVDDSGYADLSVHYSVSEKAEQVARKDIISTRAVAVSVDVPSSTSENEPISAGDTVPLALRQASSEDKSALENDIRAPPSYRQRSVWDSMQSHLTRAADSRKPSNSALQRQISTPNDSERRGAHPDNSIHPVTTKPSLLDRLSDSLQSANFHEAASSRGLSHDDTSVDLVNTPDRMDSKKSRSTTTTTLDIVAYTRARLSKVSRDSVSQWLHSGDQSGNRSIQRTQDSRRIDTIPAPGSASLPLLTLPSPSTPTAVAEASADSTPSSSDLRSKLMSKLGTEKRLQQRSGPKLVDDQTPPLSPPDAEGNTSRLSNGHGDSQMKEAKLRSQAQLRVRLALEKRKAADDLGDQWHLSEKSDEAVALESSERELRLKAKLRRARAS